MPPEPQNLYGSRRLKSALEILSFLNSVAAITAKPIPKKNPLDDNEKGEDSALWEEGWISLEVVLE